MSCSIGEASNKENISEKAYGDASFRDSPDVNTEKATTVPCGSSRQLPGKVLKRPRVSGFKR